MGKKEIAAESLISELGKKLNQYAYVYAINTIMQCNLSNKISDAWIKTALKDKQARSYVKRLAEQLRSARK
jgi:polyhydroxyalkanoate synthesis regulator phasin